MAVTITAGENQYYGAFQSKEDLTNSTATALQSFGLDHPVSTISGGTATGFGVNRYLLPTSGAVEGQEKNVVMLATGEAYIITNGTSTGALVMTAAEDFAMMKYVDAQWKLIANGGATLATATGTA